MAYVLFDIGGTKTRVAVTSDMETFGEVKSFKTPTTALKGVEAVVAAVRTLTSEPIRAIAGGIRGVVDSQKRTIVHDGTLSKWADEPIVDMLEKSLNTKVSLENDAALAGLGEVHFGAGKGYEIVVYHTISTGVGGVKIERGIIDDYATGFEPGHQILDIDHTILGEGVTPTLENLVSGSAIKERMGVEPYEIPQDDTIWNQLAYYLAHGLRNTILYWSPDVIILGGPMIVGAPRIPLDLIIRHTNDVLGDIAPCPLILEATLGNEAGLYGAMTLLKNQV